MDWKNCIAGVIQDPYKEMLWLKVLSHLEYIGYRKMVKALPQPINDENLFHHLSDEIRHSYLFQKHAEEYQTSLQVPPDKYKVLDEQLEEIAEEYFQSLDAFLYSWVQENFSSDKYDYHKLSYQFVSYVIEKRAMEVYPYYFKLVLEGGIKNALQSIIRDEGEHLDYLEDSLSSQKECLPYIQGEKLKTLRDQESKYFSIFIDAFETLSNNVFFQTKSAEILSA